MSKSNQILTSKSATALANRSYVYAQLLDDFPPSSAKWVNQLKWIGPQVVPLSDIDFDNSDSWAASDEQKKIDKFADKIRAGRLKPLILVRKGNKPPFIVVDGHHRALAYRQLGRDPLCWYADVPDGPGPWDEMHNQQEHGDK